MEGKNQTKKPAIEFDHLKRLKAVDDGSLFSLLSVWGNVWLFFSAFAEEAVKYRNSATKFNASTMCSLISIFRRNAVTNSNSLLFSALYLG